MSAPIWAVGLMTGTVLDGNIDVALLKTDGESIEQFGAYTLAPYPQDIRDTLEETLAEARRWNFDGPDPAIFAKAEEMLTRAQSAAVRNLVESAGLGMADIGVVGFHGQSVLHRAPQPGRIGATRQLGDGELMHQLLGAKVAYDFRSADVRAGGQGAPLAAIYHQALLRGLGTHGETAVLNLGGVANVTYWDGADRLVAFDTGPANAPLNDFMKAHGLGEMDRDGALARSGTVDEARLEKLLQHPYLSAPPPKSLDRFDFTVRHGRRARPGHRRRDAHRLYRRRCRQGIGPVADAADPADRFRRRAAQPADDGDAQGARRRRGGPGRNRRLARRRDRSGVLCVSRRAGAARPADQLSDDDRGAAPAAGWAVGGLGCGGAIAPSRTPSLAKSKA
jgi:1,6-anhydro-N-acetylmuramate kinase